jgi:hypothetical protein
MAARQPYDAELQMLVEPKIEWNDEIIARLRFMRWIAESGRGEHAVAGPCNDNVIDYLEEKAKREAEEQVIAAA